ncbi:hypothetical protein COU54_04620 [Candidatus Pacearchaeota archaeon CG10_big_fil_rev_8_21_14_0_10_31_24]|nr:MAG: hypothetical protein COU54_04620 [Candidatus Pacearchaeota archaeon CG10_big_fil_rev_8_21_14_0_10_31_24]
MSVVDLSSFADFLPIFSFLIVLLVVYAVLHKTGIFEGKLIQAVIAILMAVVFITFRGGREYLENVVPWFAILIMSLFFVLVLMAFVGKDVSSMGKGLGMFFVIALVLVFIISAIVVFSGDVSSLYSRLRESSSVYGAVVLVVVAGLVGWVLVKGK